MPPRKDESRQVLLVVLDENGQPAYIDATRVGGTERAQLNVNAVIVPGPAGIEDFYSDDTINALPVPPATLTLVFIDSLTGNPFVSNGIIFENLSSVNLFISFDGGLTFHRVVRGRSITWDSKGASSAVLLDSAAGGGSAYNIHVW